MPLNALTITTNSGIVGLPFAAAIGGKSAGTVLSVKPGSSPGFGIVNGVLSTLSLPYEAGAVTLNEYNPATGESLDTTLTFSGLSARALQSSVPAGGTAYRLYPVRSSNGAVVYKYAYTATGGATVVVDATTEDKSARMGLLGVRARTVADFNAFNAWLGSPADLVLQFCEGSNGATTWAQNLAIMQQMAIDWAGVNVQHEFAFPGCSTTQPMSDTVAGVYDGIIRQMCEIMVQMMPTGRIRFRLPWEANNPTAYPWSWFASGNSTAIYKAACRRIVEIARSVSSRFWFGYVPLPSTLGPDGTTVVNFEDGYPGNDVVDYLGTDFYYDATTELAGGTHIQRYRGKWNAQYGPAAILAFANANGKEFNLCELGINADAPDYLEALYSEIRQIPNLGWHTYFDVNVNQGQFKCKLSDGSKPASEVVFRRNNGPLSILTPAAFNAPTGSAFSAKLEGNKPLSWDIVGDAGPFSIVTLSDGLTSQITAPSQTSGVRNVTVRATDQRGQTVSKSLAVTFAAGALQPESQFYLSRAVTAQPAGYQTALNNLVAGLKSNGLWPLLDRMFLLQNTDAGLAVCDLMSIRHTGNLIGNTTFTAKTGIRSDGSTGYFDTLFQPSIVENRYKQNNLHFGLWSMTSLSRAGNVDSFEFGAGGTVSMFRVSNGNIAGRIGTTTAAETLAGAGWDGGTMAVRTGPAAARTYRKGVPALTSTSTSTTPPFETFKVLAAQISNGQYGANDIAIAHFGSGLGWTDANVATFYGLLQAYRNAVFAL